ncbi:hypothetical protein BU23DRAFT_565678 [Bimuria novae-zelandiae CBS 107.79]|uniref:Uncharacterized protein n=1 Tax=Bimuria novae-zelandiae CBS 107.79 TaxID=1447943 RepID=A0A6A5VG60_9PLEO|nr:hypothetical protein BU23DRAFT_565678 [Bimuria novae-zelandiae CBS 107.79]
MVNWTGFTKRITPNYEKSTASLVIDFITVIKLGPTFYQANKNLFQVFNCSSGEVEREALKIQQSHQNCEENEYHGLELPDFAWGRICYMQKSAKVLARIGNFNAPPQFCMEAGKWRTYRVDSPRMPYIVCCSLQNRHVSCPWCLCPPPTPTTACSRPLVYRSWPLLAHTP